MADFTVTTNLDHLDENSFRQRTNTLIGREEGLTPVFATLNPAATAMRTKWKSLDDDFILRDTLEEQMKACTQRITDKTKTMKSDMRAWANQMENTTGVTKAQVKDAGMGIKGEDNQHAEPTVSVTNSKPVIVTADNSRSLEITLSIINSESKSIAIPFDGKNLQIWMVKGDTFPADYHSADFQGNANNGKFTIHFTADMIGETFSFKAIYEPKKAGASVETSGQVKANVQ